MTQPSLFDFKPHEPSKIKTPDPSQNIKMNNPQPPNPNLLKLILN